jgi:hypothetical protein
LRCGRPEQTPNELAADIPLSSTEFRQKVGPLSLQRFDEPAGERIALFLVHALEPGQLAFYLAQALSQGRLGIRRGKRGVGLSLLPPGLLARFALFGARLIGDGAAHGFVDC